MLALFLYRDLQLFLLQSRRKQQKSIMSSFNCYWCEYTILRHLSDSKDKMKADSYLTSRWIRNEYHKIHHDTPQHTSASLAIQNVWSSFRSDASLHDTSVKYKSAFLNKKIIRSNSVIKVVCVIGLSPPNVLPNVDRDQNENGYDRNRITKFYATSPDVIR